LKKFVFHCNNAEDTKRLAKKLASFLKENDVITLEGELGAGKTTFTQGIAEGLGVSKTVNSPTFTIIKEYNGKLPLYHMDVYRLEESEEDLGFEEYFFGNGVTVVEWAKFIDEYLPEELVNIEISKQGDTKRTIHFIPKGDRYIQLCKELEE
jgi:tRNA threonylcarbamoyladenosine biosynthesis protein TsaE